MIYSKKGFDNNSLAVICENMLTLYESGLSFVLIFNLIKDLPIKIRYKKSLLSIAEKIKKGESLEKSFYEYRDLYPDLFTGMIGIGEKNGSLDKVLASLKNYYYKKLYISTAIKNALIYPAIIFISLFVLLVFIVVYVLPNISFIYENMDNELPKLFIISKEIKEIIISKPLLAIICLLSYLVIPFLIYEIIKDKIKINFIYKFKIVKLFYEFISISIINIIVSSGINLVLGIDQSMNSLENKYTKNILRKLKTNILEGKSLSESLKISGEFSNYSIAIVKIGEESGTIDSKLETIIVYLERNIIKIVNELMSFIQPCSILILGGVVIVFIINYILPIFDVMYSV